MKFGQHQSFYLRVNWLSKAMRMISGQPDFFHDDFGFEKIGLGRNMVRSLRHWVTATGVMEDAKGEQGQAIHQLTELGKLIADHDRFVRQPLTSAVLHIQLAANRKRATTWYWYFNECQLYSASNEQLLAALEEWVKQRHSKPVALHTLKRDLECLKLMYTARSKNDDDPEEVVASPLSALGLLYESKDQFIKRSVELGDVDSDALYYCLLVYCAQQEVNSVTLEELQVKPLLWGKLFHLSSSVILEMLERLNADPRYPVKFVRTNQLYHLTIEKEEPNAFLQRAYQRRAASDAALSLKH